MDSVTLQRNCGFDSKTGIYHSVLHLPENNKIPTQINLDVATYVLSQFPPPEQAKARVALIDSSTNQSVTYAKLRNSIRLLASGLYHKLGVRKGDVIFILSPNSVLYPIICLSVLSVGGIITTANPLNTREEIAKQVLDSSAKLAISVKEEIHKLYPTGVPVLLTSQVQDLIENFKFLEVPEVEITQFDMAAILYSSGTTGKSKGAVLTHSNLISMVTILKWLEEVTKAKDDVFLCLIPMFHIYGLDFFGLGLFCLGTTIVLMPKFDFKSMLEAIQRYGINNIPSVPPVINGLVRLNFEGYDLSSLKRVSYGAAPMSKEVVEGFRRKFPWVEFRPGYGLTEACGAATLFVTDEESKTRLESCGKLAPCFCAKVVDFETGLALPPYKKGELWLKSPMVMKKYLGNEEAFDSDGWLKTGDLCYFDEEGCLYVVDRIKELIKYNGYQVAPAELEAVLISHPRIIDAAVIPVEHEESGQIPVAYVVRAAGAELTEDQVIQFVSKQVAPYKKIRRVIFIDAIPKSAAGKILRRELVLQSKQTIMSKL